MDISTVDLFHYRQYTDAPPAFCFDRKTYQFCDSSLLSSQNSEPYTRYIPLFQIDQHELETAFLRNYHYPLLHKFGESNLCFEEFLQQNNLWNSWWDDYKLKVTQAAIQWCEENNIRYRVASK